MNRILVDDLQSRAKALGTAMDMVLAIVKDTNEPSTLPAVQSFLLGRIVPDVDNPQRFLVPISVRIVPRWITHDWHIALHPRLARGERHWYRPDGTFALSRHGDIFGAVCTSNWN